MHQEVVETAKKCNTSYNLSSMCCEDSLPCVCQSESKTLPARFPQQVHWPRSDGYGQSFEWLCFPSEKQCQPSNSGPVPRSWPRAASKITTDNHQEGLDKEKAKWNEKLQSLQVQSKFINIVALEEETGIWTKIMDGLPKGQLSFLLRHPTHANELASMASEGGIFLPTVQPKNVHNIPHLVWLPHCPPRWPLHVEAWLGASQPPGCLPYNLCQPPRPKRLWSPQVTIPIEAAVTSARPDIVITHGRELHMLELTVCGNTPEALAAAQTRKARNQSTCKYFLMWKGMAGRSVTPPLKLECWATTIQKCCHHWQNPTVRYPTLSGKMFSPKQLPLPSTAQEPSFRPDTLAFFRAKDETDVSTCHYIALHLIKCCHRNCQLAP